MRHLFTFLFLALGLQMAEAQEPYRSFLEEGKQWIIKREIPELVSTIVYKTDYPNACIYVGENPYFLREEGGKVFYPGEIELQTRRDNLENGIPIIDEKWEELKAF